MADAVAAFLSSVI